MRLTIGNLLVRTGMRENGKRSTGILARKPGVLEPPYAGGRRAACAEYRGWDVRGARYPEVTLSPCGRGSFRAAKRGEGFVSADSDPSSVAHLPMRATFSHKGR